MKLPIPYYEGLYQADAEGNIYSVERFSSMPRGGLRKYAAKKLRGKSIKGGYQMVALYKKGFKREFMSHALICQTFNGPCPGVGFEVNHRDGCKSNNQASNLEWVTRSQNVKHAFDVLGRKPSHQKEIKCIDPKTSEVVKIYSSVKSVERDGFSPTNVSTCANGRLITSGGFIWRYL